MDNAWAKLKNYTEQQDQSAFADLVREHMGLVYSAAFRQLGDSAAAEEVTQTAFILLAEKANSLQPTGSLAAWLYRTACLQAKRHRRQELARRRRETKAHDMDKTTPAADPELDWDRVAPLLDRAMASLNERDRTAVLLRYFQKRPLRDVGASLGVSEDAARKRVDRSVVKLRRWFHQRGVTCSAIALTTAMSTHSVQALPSTLTLASIQTAVAQATLTTNTASLITIMTSTKGLFSVALVLGAMLPISLSYFSTDSTDTGPVNITSSKLESLTIPDSQSSGLIAEWEALMENHGPAVGSLGEVYEVIKRIEDPFRRRAFRGALITEWIARDPQEALAYFRAEDPGRVTHCLREWLEADPRGATEAMRADPSGIEKSIRSLLIEIVAVQPEAVPSLSQHIEKRGSWTHHVRDAFAVLAESDHAMSLSKAEAMEEPQRTEALAGVAMGWAKVNGPEALQWAEALDDTTEGKGSILRSLLVGWAETDPAAALDHIRIAPPGGAELEFANDTGGQVIRAAAKANFDATLAWMGENPGKLGHEALGGLSAELGQRLRENTGSTLDMIRDHPASADLLPALHSQLLNEGYANKDAVWSWLHQQEDSEMVRDTRMRLTRSAAWKEPEVALKWLDQSPELFTAEERDQVLSAMFNGGSNLAAVEAVLDTAPDGMRERLLEQSFNYLNEERSAPLDRWIERIDALPAEKRAGASAAVARQWASVDPQQAIAWANTLTDSTQSMEALSGAVKTWVGLDSYEASEWIATLPEGSQRDHSTLTLVNGIARSEPDSAWEWAKTISQPDLRAKALGVAFARVSERDPQMANAWLQDASLTESDLQNLTGEK